MADVMEDANVTPCPEGRPVTAPGKDDISRLEAELEDVERQLADIDIDGMHDSDEDIDGDEGEVDVEVESGAKSDSKAKAPAKSTAQASAESTRSHRAASAHITKVGKRTHPKKPSSAPETGRETSSTAQASSATATKKGARATIVGVTSSHPLVGGPKKTTWTDEKGAGTSTSTSTSTATSRRGRLPAPVAGDGPGSKAAASRASPMPRLSKLEEKAVESLVTDISSPPRPKSTTGKRKKLKPKDAAKQEARAKAQARARLTGKAGAVSSKVVARATDLKAHQMEVLLGKPVMRKALKMVQTTTQELMPMTREEFKKTLQVAARSNETRVSKMFDMYEKRRHVLIKSVLEAAAVLEEQKAKREATVSSMKDHMDSALMAERKRAAKAAKQAERIHAVRELENAQMARRRQAFEAHQMEMKLKEARLLEKQKELKDKMKVRAAKRAAEAARIKSNKEQLEEEYISTVASKIALKESKAAALDEEKAAEEEAKRERERQKEEKRARKRAEAEQRELQRREAILADRRRRDAQASRAKKMAQEAVMAKIEELQMKELMKNDNVERLRRLQEYEREVMREKVEDTEQRIETLKLIREAMDRERQEERRKDLIARHKMSVATERHASPGPGQYKVPTTFTGEDGFRMAGVKPKSDLDWKLYHAKQVPGPGQYTDATFKPMGPSASLGVAKVPTELEKTIKRASELPGPAAYTSDTKFRPKTPAFSMSTYKVPSELDKTIARAAETPGPAAYGGTLKDMRRPRSMAQLKRAMSRGSMSAFGPGDRGFSPPRRPKTGTSDITRSPGLSPSPIQGDFGSGEDDLEGSGSLSESLKDKYVSFGVSLPRLPSAEGREPASATLSERSSEGD